MSKSHVAMEHYQCPICLTRFETGNVLLNTRLRPTLDEKQVTGHSPCLDCKIKLEDGYIALVETAGPATSRTVGLMVPRSGNLAWVRRTAFSQIFDQPAPETLPMVFVELGVIAKLQAMVPEEDSNG